MAIGTKRKRGTDGYMNKTGTSECPVKKDLLVQCYTTVQTLRQYLQAKLPPSSRLRRKKVASIGLGEEKPTELEASVCHLLDTSLVCSSQETREQAEIQAVRWQQWLAFSQKGDESYVTISGSPQAMSFAQSEIIDFVIWSLFTREKALSSRPKHLLCDGFRKGAPGGGQAASSISGVDIRFPNPLVKTLKSAPWPQVLALLGRSGERIMVDLLVDSSIFIAVDAGYGNYFQASGFPLYEMRFTRDEAAIFTRKPSDISLVRSRIFYAKPALTAKGLVQAGFKHIHVLNRCPRVRSQQTGLLQSPAEQAPPEEADAAKRQNFINTLKIAMYVFPRQFRLHNAFTSHVDWKHTAQKFQDYTLREAEVGPLLKGEHLPRIPKRLHGDALHLIERLQILHERCSYFELLRHYCPSVLDPVRLAKAPMTKEVPLPQAQTRKRSKKAGRSTQPALTQLDYKAITDLATPPAHVSAFCQAVLSKIVPDGFWGADETLKHNKRTFLRKVDHFIKLRRFETMSLHEIVQDFKVVDIAWLHQRHLGGQKTSQTDINKRYEIFHEFLYYVFDSLLVPLIRSNFYVTESSTHRYRVFYYRHDVWRRVAEPATAALKENMLEEVKTADASRILSSRGLGFSHLRLLPKGQGVRPIMNLRRKQMQANGGALRPSINTVLGPVHTLLKLEKRVNPGRLGSTLFSPKDMYTKIKGFKQTLKTGHGMLYFAKLDVHAAFDTIPQEAVIRLMATVPQQASYNVAKHAEIKPGERAIAEANRTATKPIRRWHAIALQNGEVKTFRERLEEDLGQRKKNTVFVASAAHQQHNRSDLLSLLAEHVSQNLVKIGKKYYRQKTGIPQGSVLSSFLCNYLYADLEIHHLDFLGGEDCLLLRLIDDFLLITLDRSKAERFVETMHRGLPDYGVQVSAAKTLVNFEMALDGEVVSEVGKGAGFPYCGVKIDTKTLEISKDIEKGEKTAVGNSLTVEYGRSPGQNFERKVLGAFKIQSHLMFFDTEHNSARTVLATLRAAFEETARKMSAYIKCMPKGKQPTSKIITSTNAVVVACTRADSAGTIIKLTDLALRLLTGRSRKLRNPEYQCDIRRRQVALAAYEAFATVLRRKQTKYTRVLAWLDKEAGRLRDKN